MKKKCEISKTHTHTHLHIMNAWNFVWGWLLCMRHLSLSRSFPLFLCRFLCFYRSHTTWWLSEFQSNPHEMSEKCHPKQFQMSSSSMLLHLTTFTSRSFHFVPFIYHSISNRDALYWRKYVKRENRNAEKLKLNCSILHSITGRVAAFKQHSNNTETEPKSNGNESKKFH